MIYSGVAGPHDSCIGILQDPHRQGLNMPPLICHEGVIT